MSTSTTHPLDMSRTIEASPERVFEAWTTPGQMKQWHAPEAVEVVSASVGLRVGGVYRDIRAGERRVHTSKWEEPEHDAGERVISVSFHAVDGGTRIVVVHDLSPSREARDEHDEGWASCLDRLGKMFA